MNATTDRTPRGFVRMMRDGELIVCLQFALNAGWVCVDGKPDYDIVFVWAE